MLNEKRLIYASEALRMIENSRTDNPYFNGKTTTIWEKAHDCALSCVVACQTIEATEVVRCKDCKHFIQEEHGCNHFGYYSHTPWVDELDFCSYGERRNNE